jgi:putative ABC transport system substrate-binding protein
MRRREFMALIGGTVAWPLRARAQQAVTPVVAVLRPNPKNVETFVEPFGRYMRAVGWQEGGNIRFQFVWAEGRNERLPALASDLVAKQVNGAADSPAAR